MRYKLFFLILLVSGCSRYKKEIHVSFDSSREEVIARLSMIPDTPFFACITRLEQERDTVNNVHIEYEFSGKNEIVQGFYTEQMVRLGWNKISEIITNQQILIFEKPDMVCIIEIRPKEHRYSVALGRKIHL